MRLRHAPETILGIYDGTHDAGAALVRGGALVAAASEERFSRLKGAGGWPSAAVRSVLRTAGVGLPEVDHVAFAGLVNPNPGLRTVRTLQRQWRLEGGWFYTEADHVIARGTQWLQFSSPFPYLRSTSPWVRAYAPALRRVLVHQLGWDQLRDPAAGPGRGGAVGPLRLGRRARRVTLHDHHLCHAASAYHTCGHERALVVVVDGIGDGLAGSVWRGDGGRLEGLAAIPYPHSYGLLAATITGFLGFRPFRHEGKLTALAAHGDAGAVDVPWPFEGPAHERRFTQRWGLQLRPWLERLSLYSQEDLAAWLQRGLERDLCALVDHWLSRTGLGAVALAGGVFANVPLNARVAALPGVQDLFIFPHMGDGGLAAGAALLVAAAARPDRWRPRPLPHVFLGPGWSEEEEERTLRRLDVPYRRPRDLAAELASRLAMGQVVARCDGRMEFGPRALGNRSILAPAVDPDTTASLNRKLRRSPFMPFAPLLAEEDAGRWIEGGDRVRHALEFMTVAVTGTEPFRERCPGAVHVDGTLRPQLVTRRAHPGLHAVLQAYRARTGRPSIINTSFNLHEEPIVCSPEDAVRTFRLAKLDALALGPFLVTA